MNQNSNGDSQSKYDFPQSNFLVGWLLLKHCANMYYSDGSDTQNHPKNEVKANWTGLYCYNIKFSPILDFFSVSQHIYQTNFIMTLPGF